MSFAVGKEAAEMASDRKRKRNWNKNPSECIKRDECGTFFPSKLQLSTGKWTNEMGQAEIKPRQQRQQRQQQQQQQQWNKIEKLFESKFFFPSIPAFQLANNVEFLVGFLSSL